jgi:hypothetical protein
MNLFHKLTVAGTGSSGGSSSGSADPFLNQVSVLLHANGTNGAQNSTFTDSSDSALTVTRTGNASQGTFTPFSHDTSYWSTYYSTSGYSTYATMSTSIIDVKSTATFTVEGWIMLTGAAASYYTMVCTTDFGSSVNWDAGVNSSRQVNFYWYVGGVFNCTGTTVLNYYQWYFIQIRCVNGAITLGVNGVAETLTGTTTIGNPGNSTYFSIGRERSFNNPCYLYDVRVSNISRSYTLPTVPQIADANTTFLGIRKKTYLDESSLATTLINSGVSSPYSPFGTGRATPYNASVVGGSTYFDGAGDYLTVAGSSAIDIGSNDFSIEFWVYFSQAVSNQMIVYDNRNTGTQAAPCIYVFTTMRYYVSGADRITSNTTISAGAWFHVAVSRVSGTTRMFINGITQTQTYTDSTVYTNQTNRPTIGAAGDVLGGGPLLGYMSSVRLVVGSGFTSVTVPTAPLTASAIANTKLLLNFTTGGVIDNTGRNNIETVSTAQINTSVTKFGTGSIQFNGSSAYLNLPTLLTDTYLNLLGDYTVECWVYLTSLPDCSVLQLAGNSGTWAALRVNVYTSGQFVLLSTTNGSAWQINGGTGAGTVVINTWYHVAIVRNGGTITLYQNGAAGITSTAIAATTALLAGTINYIGAISGPTYYFPGYIDEFRITRGRARYTAPFTSTVPTAAFGDK